MSALAEKGGIVAFKSETVEVCIDAAASCNAKIAVNEATCIQATFVMESVAFHLTDMLLFLL